MGRKRFLGAETEEEEEAEKEEDEEEEEEEEERLDGGKPSTNTFSISCWKTEMGKVRIE